MSVIAEKRYTSVAIILHWLIAILIFLQIAGGVWMTNATDADQKLLFTTFQLHKTFGLIILALSIARIIWRLAHPAPPLPFGMTAFERFAAIAAHWLFYGAMFAIPLSGWIMVSVSATGIPTFFFMIEALPFLHLPIGTDWSADERHAVEVIFKQAHFILAALTVLLFFAHVGAALKHQFIARDNLIARMVVSDKTEPQTPAKTGPGIFAFGLAALFLAFGLVGGRLAPAGAPPAQTTELSAPVKASDWIIDQEQSSLGFTLTFQNNPVTGSFSTWQAAVSFSPDAPDTASARVEIATGSVTISDGYLNGQSTGADGFDSANHPTAVFESTGVRDLGDGRFEMDGNLTLKDSTSPLIVAFTFSETDGIATVSGTGTLDRREFAMGTSAAADEQWLKFPVELNFELTASRAE